MTWSEFFSQRLPLDENGDVILRELEGEMQVGERTIPAASVETIAPAAIVAVFSGQLTDEPPEEGPMPSTTFASLLASADASGLLWRGHWERWRSEGRL